MSPLSKRLPREFKGNLGKWLGIVLLLTLTISLVAGFLMASSSMTVILNAVDDDYHVEDGRFTANFEVSDDVIDRVEDQGVTVYENFSYAVDLKLANSDTAMTARVYENREVIDLPAYFEGKAPEAANEIALDRVFCNNNGLSVGETVTVDGRAFVISGIMSLSDYQALFEKNTDFVFNAQTFTVAQVSSSGFATFKSSPCTYTYSFMTNDRTLDDKARTDLEEDILDVLEDENVTLSDFLDRDSNQAIGYAQEDLESDSVMWMVLLYMLIVILAFVFVVLTSATIEDESAVIGTLLASGYRKGELLRHYISLPLISGLIGAVVGNALGYAFLIEMMSGLYYNSYSLPPYHTIWDWSVFAQSTLLPLALLMLVTTIGLLRKLRCTPLQFLRHETSKRSRRGGRTLPSALSFSARFRLRVLGRNASHFATLFVGILFASLLLLFGFCLLPTVDRYAESLSESLVSEHTYTLKTPVELEGTAEEKEAYAAALKLADTVDMAAIDEDELEDKLTSVLEDRIESDVEDQVEDLFDEDALEDLIQTKAEALIDQDRIVQLALAGADVSSLGSMDTSSLSTSDVQQLVDLGILKSTWIDLSYYGLDGISLLYLPGDDWFDSIDTDDLNWDHLVEAGIMRSSSIDLTRYGLGVVDLATFDSDSIDADDIDFDAIDFSDISKEDLGLENVDLGDLTLNEFFSLVEKASDIDEDAHVVNTQDNSAEAIAQAEKFTAASLEYDRGGDSGWESVTLYGIQNPSRYYDMELSGDTIAAGLGLVQKFDLKVGDTIELYDKYENKTYDLVIGSVWGSDGTMNVYMSMDAANALFDNDSDYFSGYLSDLPLQIDERYVANDLTPSEMSKISAQMESSMGDMMNLIVGVSIAIYLVLMYLLTKTIIERSARSISYMKVFGYADREINRLYVRSITEAVIVSLLVAIPIVYWLIVLLVKVVFISYNGNFVVDLPTERLLIEFALGLVCYAVVAFLHTRRIKKVPMALALKIQE